jgi:hypothetical protein
MADNPDFPPDDADLAYVAITTALETALPVVGPAAVAVFQALVGSPVDRRRSEFLADLWRKLKELEDRKQLRVEDLPNNDVFVDAVLNATAAAIRTSQAEKKRALRNAVMNAALSSAPDASREQIFLQLTDRFTDKHLLLLSLFHAPTKWPWPPNHTLRPARSTGTTLLEAAFPDAITRPDLYHKVWSDLYTEKLVTTAAVDNGMEGDWQSVKRTTPLGAEYLAFISEPA